MSTYPAQIDDNISLPPAVDGVTPVSGSTYNALRTTVIQIEAELGVKPSGIYGTVRARLDALDAQIAAIIAGGGGGGGGGTPVTFAGDLAGSATHQVVVGLYTRPLSPNAPVAGQAIIWDGYIWASSTNFLGQEIISGPALSTSDTTGLITLDGKFVVNAITTSLISDAGQGIIYFDGYQNKFLASENGGPYVDLVFDPPGVGPIVSQVSGSPIVLASAEGEVPMIVGGIPQPVGGRRVFNVLSFGAVGDGIHDDSAAIQAAEHARSLFGAGERAGGVVYFPPGTYKINSEVHTEGANWIWEGDGGNGGSTIFVGTSIRAAISIRHQFGAMRDLFIDAHDLADYAILRAGDSQSVYTNINIFGPLLDGFSSIGAHLPGRSISGIVQTGPGPTISATASVLVGVEAQYATLRVKIVTTGTTDGTGQYQVSQDGGGSFGITQNIYPTSHPALVRGPNNPANDSGVTITFSGIYQSGTTYDINFDYSISGDLAINDETQFHSCSSAFCGTWFRTSGGPFFPGPHQTTIPGTIDITHGNQVVTGTGTNFTTTRARPGDYLWVWGQQQFFQILCVLDDTHIAIGAKSANRAVTATGQDFIISVGAGWYNAFQFDGGVQNILGGNYGSSCCQSMVDLGTSAGNLYSSVSTEGQSGIAFACGLDASSFAAGNVLLRPYFEGSAIYSVGVDENSQALAIINPTNLTTTDEINPPTYNLILNGTYVGRVNHLLISEHWLATTFNVTADNQAPPVPNFSRSVNEPSSTILLSATGAFTLGTLAATNINSTVVRLANLSAFPLTLHDQSVGGGYNLQSATVVLFPGSFIELYFFNGGWHQAAAVTAGSLSSSGTMGDGSAYVVTTDSTATRLTFINPYDRVDFTGFSADVSAYTSDGTQVGIWEGFAARFANQAQIGSITIDHRTGTNAGDIPAGWMLALTGGVGTWQLTVTGVVATTINWRMKIRYF